jgi:hypothetical protein
MITERQLTGQLRVTYDMNWGVVSDLQYPLRRCG